MRMYVSIESEYESYSVHGCDNVWTERKEMKEKRRQETAPINVSSRASSWKRNFTFMLMCPIVPTYISQTLLIFSRLSFYVFSLRSYILNISTNTRRLSSNVSSQLLRCTTTKTAAATTKFFFLHATISRLKDMHMMRSDHLHKFFSWSYFSSIFIPCSLLTDFVLGSVTTQKIPIRHHQLGALESWSHNHMSNCSRFSHNYVDPVDLSIVIMSRRLIKLDSWLYRMITIVKWVIACVAHNFLEDF